MAAHSCPITIIRYVIFWNKYFKCARCTRGDEVTSERVSPVGYNDIIPNKQGRITVSNLYIRTSDIVVGISKQLGLSGVSMGNQMVTSEIRK